MFNLPTETWERRGKKVQREGGEKREDQGGEGYDKGYKGGENDDNENKNVDPGKMKINCTNTTQQKRA